MKRRGFIQTACARRGSTSTWGMLNLARIRLNGQALGVQRRAPYVFEVTRAIVAGRNRLETVAAGRLMGPERVVTEVSAVAAPSTAV